MRLITALLVLFLAAAFAHAQQPAPFAHADIKAGAQLVETNCVSCHAAMFSGDAERIYTRPERKMKSAEQLLSQVRVCNTNLKKNWFPEDEDNAAAFLNSEYYKFK
jgi:cytochrome c553